MQRGAGRPWGPRASLWCCSIPWLPAEGHGRFVWFCGCFHSVWGGRARGCPAPELEDSPTAGGGGWRQGGGGGPTRRPPGPLARRRRRPLPAQPPRGQRRCTHEAAWRVPRPWTCRQVERRAPVTRVGVARQTASPSGASPGARARAHLLSDHRPPVNRTLARLATGWCPQVPALPTPALPHGGARTLLFFSAKSRLCQQLRRRFAGLDETGVASERRGTKPVSPVRSGSNPQCAPPPPAPRELLAGVGLVQLTPVP